MSEQWPGERPDDEDEVAEAEADVEEDVEEDEEAEGEPEESEAEEDLPELRVVEHADDEIEIPVAFGVLVDGGDPAELGAEAVRRGLEMADLFQQLRASARAV